MMRHQYNITIVGAGPCGSIMAYELAKKGVKVLMIDKEKHPHIKTCAGGITFRAASLIPFDFNDVVEDVIYGARLSYKLIPHKTRRYDLPLAYMVKRDKFDYLLASKACQAGATLQEGVEVLEVESSDSEVQVKTRYDNFSTEILVGADGANSIVVKSLGIKNGFDYGLAVNSLIPATLQQIHMWDGLIGLDWGIPGGYAWVFPKNDCFSIGAGSSFKRSRSFKSYTQRLINSLELGNNKDAVIRGHLMPIRKPRTPLSYGRILLVGDAAGVIDPLSGEGIYYGLKSVYLALPAVLDNLERKKVDLSEYDQMVNSEMAPELKIARTIHILNDFAPRIFFQLINGNNRVWRAFCRMLRGEKTYAGLKQSLPAPVRLGFKVL